MKSVSCLANRDKIDKSRLNVIATGVDNGKAWYIGKRFFMDFPEYKPNDALLITSHLSVFHDHTTMKTSRDIDYSSYITSSGVNVMSYNDLFNSIIRLDNNVISMLNSVKVIFFDEFQTIYMRNNVFRKFAHMSRTILSKATCPSAEIFIAFASMPQIMKANTYDIEIGINWMNTLPVVRNRADDFICTRPEVLSKMTEFDLRGKTLILCLSAKDCVKLHREISNSAVLISKSGSCKILPHTAEMDRIKEYMVKNHKFPETTTTDGLEHPIDVIITTYIPEGLYFTEDSNILNIICCTGSDVIIGQVASRLTYDYECLIVTGVQNKNIFKNERYVTDTDAEFVKFFTYLNDYSWVDPIIPYVKCKRFDVDIWDNPRQSTNFTSYINERWLCREEFGNDEMYERRIWKESDKQEIINAFIKYRMNAVMRSKSVTLSRVMSELSKFGYEVKGGSMKCNGERHSYRQIFIKPRKPILLDLVESMRYPETMEWETVGVTKVPFIL